MERAMPMSDPPRAAAREAADLVYQWLVDDWNRPSMWSQQAEDRLIARIDAFAAARVAKAKVLEVEPGTPPKLVLRAWQERVAAALHLLDEDAVVHPNQGTAAQKARRILRALRAPAGEGSP